MPVTTEQANHFRQTQEIMETATRIAKCRTPAKNWAYQELELAAKKGEKGESKAKAEGL